MGLIRKIFDTKGAPILGAVFVSLIILESRYQLRKRVQDRRVRIVINAISSVPAFVLLRLMLIPAMVGLARSSNSKGFGIVHLITKNKMLQQCLAFLLLDYSNYAWHILNHKLPFLWRFHLVHHTDLDLDVSTATRFHFGEMIGSVVYRGTCVRLIGASPGTVLWYEIAFEAATQFHHSNMKLPLKIERLLNYIIVTPRMHGIHHSMKKNETDSNYSVIFSFWDKIHHTARLAIPQDELVIGVPAYSDPGELTIGFLLTLPFKKIRSWSGENH